jgi:hypothetical protein
MKPMLVLLIFTFCIALTAVPFASQENSDSPEKTLKSPSKLMILWTSGDREVAVKMVFMYAYNAQKRGWWDQVNFIVWGPSSKLLSSDNELQQEIKKMIEAGVKVEACKACADLYGVSDRLAALGITVQYMGVPLTNRLKSGWTSLTF